MNYKQTLTGGIIAFILATACCWIPFLAIVIGGASGLLALSESMEEFSLHFIIIGAILTSIGAWQFYNRSKKGSHTKEIMLKSTLTCPSCGHKKKEIMPTNGCQYFYECTNCHEILKPRQGDCCVFCSYGSVKCPPIQSGGDCC